MRELVNVSNRRPLWNAFNDFDSIFDEFWGPRRPVDRVENRTFVPAVDVSETENAYRIKAEIPGVRKEDLNVSVHDGILTIEAETKYEDEEKKDGRVIRRERRYGKFSRSIRLGEDVDSTSVKAEYKDGVLDLMLPKLEEVQPKRIAITVN